ncbi:leucine-rich repeat neuronal protein 1 [Diretmus argenteus]
MGSVVLMLLLVSLMTSSVCAGGGGPIQGGAVLCPLQCVCETRPWYTPQSVYHQARTVDCNELHLRTVPANVSTDTQVLLLQSNNISSITTELQSLTNLTELDLSQNHFTQVSSMGLSTLGQLVTLYLEENQVEELEDFGLRNLSSLEELYINHNHISSIGPKAFAGLTNLLRLHLNSNRLVAIDSRWFESLPSLEILMIGENPILGLEDRNFLPLSRLHSLVLAGMSLAGIPPGAFLGLEYLESLSFYNNQLRSVPREALSVLPNLKFLDLNRNPIGRVQQGDFQNLPHLEELSLNNMDELLLVDRGAFQNLPEMAKLELYNNPRLSYIDPQAFSDLGSLRTLLLHNNQLSLLSRDLLSSLPSLEELSIHSNPLRCDCLATWGPHLGNQSNLKLLEAPVTLCSSPSHLIGQELQEVVSIGWGANVGGSNSCLPHISPHAFPPVMNVSAGQPITLECWANADPAPQFYWVTPTGDKVTSEAVAEPIISEQGRDLTRKRKKHRVSDPGALVIEHVELADAGLYTCVAWNPDGADTKSVSVFVDSQGSWSGQGSQQGGQSSREEPWLGNSSSAAGSLVVLAKVVHAQSVVLEWKLYPSGGALSLGQNQQDPLLPLPRWTSATVHIDNPQISYTAKVPVDVQEYNLTHLLPATEYHVCLTVSSFPPSSSSSSPPPTSTSSPTPTPTSSSSSPVHTSCLNITTKEAGFSVELVASRQSSVALAAVMGSMFALSIMALLVVYMGRRVQHKSCGHSLKKYMQHATSIPLNEFYPPLITLWESEAEKEKEEKEDRENDREEPAGSQIDTSKTYMW